MLFVDDDDTKTMKLHRLLNKSMSTDRDIDAAVGKARKYIAAPLRRHTARQ